MDEGKELKENAGETGSHTRNEGEVLDPPSNLKEKEVETCVNDPKGISDFEGGANSLGY